MSATFPVCGFENMKETTSVKGSVGRDISGCLLE